MKKLLLLFMLIATAIGARAQTSQPTLPTGFVNGIFYIFDDSDNTATVGDPAYWAKPSSTYEGDIVIPASVVFKDRTYTVTRIAAYAFSDNHPDITSVEIPNSVTTLDTYAFDGTVITSLDIPNSVKTIGADCFEYSSLTSINFGNGVTSIGSNAFRSCSSLTTVSIAATTPPAIEANTFPTAIKSKITLTVPSGCVAAYKSAANWSGFKEYKEAAGGGGGGNEPSEPAYVQVDNLFYYITPATQTALVTSGYKAGITEVPYAGEITVPSTFEYKGTTYTVTGVTQQAFQYATCSKVTLPASCKLIDAYAFDSMTGLTTLNIGGTTEIKGNGISGCSALTDLYIGNTSGVVSTVNLSITAAARANLNVHLPNATLINNYYADSFWKTVKALLKPECVMVGDLYYQYYPSNNTAMVLAPYTIYGNGKPAQIGPTVEVPGSIMVDNKEYTVTNLEAGVFYDTPNVTAVKFNEGLTNVEYETFYMTNITEVVFPNSLENLEYNNFYGCQKLQKVTFGTGFKTLGNNQFYYATAMTDITVLAEVPPTAAPGTAASAVFATTNFKKSEITLHIPAGTKAAYQASTIWSGFKDYVEIGGSQPSDPAYVEVDNIYYHLNPTAKTAAVTSGYTAGISETPYSGVVNVPSSFTYSNTEYTVIAVEDRAFEYSTCTSITLPSTCTALGTYTFDGSTALTRLDLGGVTSISGNGLGTCQKLRDIILGYSAGVVNITSATIKNCNLDSLNVHIPSLSLKSIYGSSEWAKAKIVVGPNTLEINRLYYQYYPESKTAMVLAVYDYPGNGNAGKQIGPDVDVLGSITVDGTEYTVTSLEPGVFYETPNAKTVTFHEGLKTVGYETFYGSQFEEVVFPNSMETLENYNFYSCYYLKKVTFGTGFKTMEHTQFANCFALTDITVLATTPPTAATGTDASTVMASNLKKELITLHVPYGSAEAYRNSVIWGGFKAYEEIGEPTRVKVDGIYYELTKTPYADESGVRQCYVACPVESGYPTGEEYSGNITIPESITVGTNKFAVTQVAYQAFYMQSNLTDVTLPSTVTILGASSFAESSLTSFTIPESVKRIDNYAFRKCTSLKSLKAMNVTPPAATSNSFVTITSSCTLYVPRGCVNTYKNAEGWKDFQNIEEDPDSPILPVSVTITGAPKTMLKGDTVRLTAVITPADVTDSSVEWKSLSPTILSVDSTGLVTALGTGNALIEVICNGDRRISTNVSIVAAPAQGVIDGLSYRFELNEQKKIANAYLIRPTSGNYAGAVVIPSTVQNVTTFTVRGIDANAFALNKEVSSVTIPATIDTIGFNAFRLCDNLKSVNITNLTAWANISFRDQLATPFNITGVKMYLNGKEVTEVNIAGNIATIKPYVFQGIASISKVTIAEGVRRISTSAFADCTGLTSIVLPESIDSIGLSVFKGCSSLASANIPSGMRTVPAALFSGTALKSIVIPAGVTVVDNQAFQNCTELKKVELGATVNKFNLWVFDGCTQLDSIISHAVVPPTFFQAAVQGQMLEPFSTDIYPTCVVEVPAESVEAYRKADIWKKFAKVQAIGAGQAGVKDSVDGIYYQFFANNKNAIVLPAAYSGELTIPATVLYEGIEYVVDSIAPGAFSGTTIDILRLNNNIRHIPANMASDCPELVSVGLPDNLETIGMYAFYNSPAIRFIRCVNYGKNNSLIPPTFAAVDGNDYGCAFSESIWPDCMLVIPASMYANYKQSAGWKNFRTWAYWHNETDIELVSAEFTENLTAAEGKTLKLVPTTTPADATVLNYVVKTEKPEIASFSTVYENQKPVLQVQYLKQGTTKVTVYMNLIKTSFELKCSNTEGVDGVENDTDRIRYFNLQGLEEQRPVRGKVYIKVSGNKIEKIVY